MAMKKTQELSKLDDNDLANEYWLCDIEDEHNYSIKTEILNRINKMSNDELVTLYALRFSK